MPRILGSTGDGYKSRPVVTWSALYFPPARMAPGRYCSTADIIILVCRIPQFALQARGHGFGQLPACAGGRAMNR